MSAVELRDVTKSFSSFVAIHRVSLSIGTGQSVVFIGPSGAGKTTLLRLIAGLEKPDAGQILLDGSDVSLLPPKSRRVAYLTQDYALYPQLTVQQNIKAALAPLQLPARQQTDRLDEVIEWFELRSVLAQRPAELSGGQAQRVALAKAVVRRPAVLLLDEPLSQLDMPLREQMRLLLMDVIDHYATTLLMVTHDPIDAMSMANHIGVIHRGELIQFDDATATYQRPQSRVAAELLSPYGINWLDARAIREIPFLSIHRDKQHFQHVGFRAEDCQLHHGDAELQSDGTLQLAVSVRKIRYLGFASLVVVEWAGQILLCLSPQLALADTWPPASNALLSVPIGKLHWV